MMNGEEPLRYVAFIRNIMVGREGLSADVLRHAAQQAGADSPRSYLATGNLTFFAPPDRLAVVVRGLEDAIAAVIGRTEEVFARPLESLIDMVDADPFTPVAAENVYERCVTFLSTDASVPLELPTETRNGDALLFASSPGQVLSITRRVNGRPGQPGRVIESAMGGHVTTRNWNTIQRIVRLERRPK